jgi:hypothetical protein
MTTGAIGSSVVVGFQAGSGVVTADISGSVIIGRTAGVGSSPIPESVFIGTRAGYSTGASLSGAVAIGSSSGALRGAGGGFGGVGQIAIGQGSQNALNNTSNYTVTVGHAVAQALTAGADYSVVIGGNACAGLSTGARNIVIGGNACPTLTTGSNNLLLGYGANVTAANRSDWLEITNQTAGATTGLIQGSFVTNDRRLILNGAEEKRRGAHGITGNGGDETIIGCTASNITVTLTSAMIARVGRIWIIKDESGTAAGGSPITVATEGAETIDGAASATITTAYGVLRLYSNGSNLFTI